jgi:hypothetical protein
VCVPLLRLGAGPTTPYAQLRTNASPGADLGSTHNYAQVCFWVWLIREREGEGEAATPKEALCLHRWRWPGAAAAAEAEASERTPNFVASTLFLEPLESALRCDTRIDSLHPGGVCGVQWSFCKGANQVESTPPTHEWAALGSSEQGARAI